MQPPPQRRTAGSLRCCAAQVLLPVLVLLVPTSQAQVAQPSAEAASMQHWIVRTGDHRARPFVIVDKREARLWIYDARGQLVESTAVLLGSARGDASVPGIGQRPLGQIRADERTTPAGRFWLEPGRNLAGEDILWLDYGAAVSLHRVRPGGPQDRRLPRLMTRSAADNRISYGCINVPIAVYNRSLHAAFSSGGGYAYVLPEVQSLRQAFPFVQPLAARAAAARAQGGVGGVGGAQPRSARAGRVLPMAPLPLLLPPVAPLALPLVPPVPPVPAPPVD